METYSIKVISTEMPTSRMEPFSTRSRLTLASNFLQWEKMAYRLAKITCRPFSISRAKEISVGHRPFKLLDRVVRSITMLLPIQHTLVPLSSGKPRVSSNSTYSYLDPTLESPTAMRNGLILITTFQRTSLITNRFARLIST